MRILYVNGPYRGLNYSRCSRSPAVTKSGTLYYPFWLCYAAGLAMRETGYEVRVLDAVASRLSEREVGAHAAQWGADIAVVDTSTASLYEDAGTAGAIKAARPGCVVVMAGTAATAEPEFVMSLASGIDAAARGEYDETVIELARAVEAGSVWDSVAGLSFRRDGEVVHTGERGLIGDLDRFPFVGEVYDRCLHAEDYFFSAAQYPMTMTVTSRGCPHRCGWCLYPQVMHRGKYRMRSAASVAAEFADIAERSPGIREVGIEDDLFTGDRGRVHEICERLIGQGNRLGFWCDTRIDLDYETMRVMKAAGCRLLITGFESADQTTLDAIKKGTRAEAGYEFVQNARRAGLLVHGCFVLGNPGETRETMQATLEYAKKLNPDTAQFFPMMVYPGTRMYQWASESGYLRVRDYRQWLTEDGLHTSVVDQPGLPGADVVRFCDYSRREFYLRRQYIFHKLAQSIRNPHEARRNLKAFGRFAKFLVRAT